MSWHIAKLNDVATIERDGIASDAIATGTRYLGLEHIESGGKILGSETVAAGDLASTKFRFTDRHVLYGKLRPYLAKIATPDFDGICSTDIVPIMPGSKLDRSFLTHFLRQPSMIEFANSRTTGANLPRLSPKALAEFEVPLPPLEEQKRIAAILDQADELRRKRQRALDRLNQLGQALFHEMFGDSTSNPKGWKEDSLGSIVRKGDKINYGVVQPGDHVEDGIPLIRVGDLLKPTIEPTKAKRISTEIEANYKRSRLVGDEILIGCVGSIGTVALAHAGLKGANIARAVARVPVNSGVAEREFVAEMIRSPLVQRYFAAETRTVAQPTLNINLIVSAPIFVPPLGLQKEFVARISALRLALAGNGRSAIFLDELFFSLQHRAFRGEL